MKFITVLIVDDSTVIRQALTNMLNAAEGINVLAAVADPMQAMDQMKIHWPDVVVLDVETPRSDGLTFLKMIMREKPTPVIISSTLTEQGAQTTMQALASGAVAVVTKPKPELKQFLYDSSEDLIAAVREAARANIKPPATGARQTHPKTNPTVAPALPPSDSRAMRQTTERIVAIGTSTGGTQALEEVLTALPRATPGIIIVQHMPEKFTAAFAARLDSICEIDVREARNNDRVMPSLALIAPGGKHMQLRRNGMQYFVEIVDGPLVNRHRPSVDVLFRSVAQCAGVNALGIIMTGMGDDGADGLLEMRNAGARTVAQDEESCIVYGMPKEAVKRGAVERSLPLQAIHKDIIQQLTPVE